jgi:vancomycin resistance protein YoaR
VEVRKTEYVVRGSTRRLPFASLQTRPPRRRRRGEPLPYRILSWAQGLLDWLRGLPFQEVAALPWRAIAIGTASGLLALLIVSMVVFEVAYANRVQPGVHALGVDLGGKSVAEAQVALAGQLDQYIHQPLEFTYAERHWRTTPADLGMQLDVAPIVEAAYAMGRSGNPLERLVRPVRSVFGLQEVPQPPVLLDASRVDRYLADLASAVNRRERDAHLVIDSEGRVNYTTAETRRELDVARTRERLQRALLVGDAPVVTLAVDERQPAITDAHLATAREQAERLLGEPIALQLGSDSWTLGAIDLVAAVELVGPTDRPTGARVKDAALEQVVRRAVRDIEQPAANARFELASSDLRTIRESREGREVDYAAVLSGVRRALGSDDRVVEVPAKITTPQVTSAERGQLGIHELIARGETRFAGSSPPKIHNIKLAASRLHGVVVPPGAMFSFNRELGPTTLDSGYQVGWGIASTGNGGHSTVPSVAGGICQVATTMFQPVYWGGYQVEERHSHLYWIPGYGIGNLGRVGLDATVDEDTGLDFRFLNSSPDYVLIQTATDDTSVSIALYGNKPTWTVKVEGPTITNRKPASLDLVRAPEPSLPWGQRLQVESAGDGFDAALVRTVDDRGSMRTLNLKTHYEPSQNLVVVGVMGAPAGAAEEIRASNRPTTNQAVADVATTTTAAPTAVLQATSGPAPTLGATPILPSAGVATTSALLPTTAPAVVEPTRAVVATAVPPTAAAVVPTSAAPAEAARPAATAPPTTRPAPTSAPAGATESSSSQGVPRFAAPSAPVATPALQSAPGGVSIPRPPQSATSPAR